MEQIRKKNAVTFFMEDNFKGYDAFESYMHPEFISVSEFESFEKF